MLSWAFPYPPTRGGTQIRTFNLIKYLSQRHDITLVTQCDEDVTSAAIATLQELVANLVTFPLVSSPPAKSGLLDKAKRFSKLISQGTPNQVLAHYSPAMYQWVEEAISSQEFDVLTSEHSDNEIYVHSEWHKQLRTVVNIHSSVVKNCQAQLDNPSLENELREQLNLPLLRRYEQRYCAKFSCVVVTSKEDKKYLKNLAPDSEIHVIPNGVDLKLFPKRVTNQGGQRLIFVGAMDNPADIDAVDFFCRKILPAIRSRYPESTLELVGSRPVEQVKELAAIAGVKVTSQVTSLAEYLHWATVCVVPMRIGSGMKNKTLEAMAAGVPVVASDRGLDGLVVDGADVPLRAMRANSVDEYVYAIGRLFAEPKLREKLSENGRTMIEKEYTWERAGARYEQVLIGQ